VGEGGRRVAGIFSFCQGGDGGSARVSVALTAGVNQFAQGDP
jgi:hypothetical protein